MTDFLAHLIQQSQGESLSIQPLIPPLFAPSSLTVPPAGSLLSALSLLPSALVPNLAVATQSIADNGARERFTWPDDLVPLPLRHIPTPLMILQDFSSSLEAAQPGQEESTEEYPWEDFAEEPYAGHFSQERLPEMRTSPIPATPSETSSTIFRSNLIVPALFANQQDILPTTLSDQRGEIDVDLLIKKQKGQHRSRDMQADQDIVLSEQSEASLEVSVIVPANQPDRKSPLLPAQDERIDQPSRSNTSSRLADTITPSSSLPANQPGEVMPPALIQQSQREIKAGRSQDAFRLPHGGDKAADQESKQLSGVSRDPSESTQRRLQTALASTNRSSQNQEINHDDLQRLMGLRAAPNPVIGEKRKGNGTEFGKDRNTPEHLQELALSDDGASKEEPRGDISKDRSISKDLRAYAAKQSAKNLPAQVHSSQSPSENIPGWIYPALRTRADESRTGGDIDSDLPSASYPQRRLRRRIPEYSVSSTKDQTLPEQPPAETQATLQTVSQPVIHIRIGRVEVRAPAPAPSSPVKRADTSKPAFTLSEYLRQRRGNIQ